MKKLWFEIFWNWWHSSVCDIALTFIWRRKYIFDKCGRREIFFFCFRKLLPPTYLTKYPSFSYSQEVFLLILAVRSSPVDLFTAQQNHRCSYHTKTISQSNQAYFLGALYGESNENNWNAIFYTELSPFHLPAKVPDDRFLSKDLNYNNPPWKVPKRQTPS